MDKLEKVELIREKTGVSYDDANAALAASNDDVLDAIIFLERVGKAQPQSASFTSTGADAHGTASAPETGSAQQHNQGPSRSARIAEVANRVCNAITRFMRASLDTSFVITRRGERLFSMPALFIILGIFLWWAAFPLLVIGLFCDCRYQIEGNQPITAGVNKVMDIASDSASSIKESVMGDNNEPSEAQN